MAHGLAKARHPPHMPIHTLTSQGIVLEIRSLTAPGSARVPFLTLGKFQLLDPA